MVSVGLECRNVPDVQMCMIVGYEAHLHVGRATFQCKTTTFH